MPISKNKRGLKAATIVDVANEAQVGWMTVSRTLKNPDLVSDELRSKVLKAIKKLGYKPSRLASALSGGAAPLVPIIVPSLHHPVYVPFLDGACEVLGRMQYQVLLGVTDYESQKEAKLLESLLEWSPAGILLAGVDHSRETLKIMKGTSVPIVEYMDIGKDKKRPNVGISNYEVGVSVANYFADKGYTRIAYAGNLIGSDPKSVKRIAGFQSALSNRGLRNDLVLSGDEPFSMNLGGRLMSDLLRGQPDVQAVFFSNDDLAAGAIFECHRRGLHVPKDIAIMGFNDLEIASEMVPSITTIRTPREEMGKAAATLLLDLIKGENLISPVVDLGFKIIERESTRVN